MSVHTFLQVRMVLDVLNKMNNHKLTRNIDDKMLMNVEKQKNIVGGGILGYTNQNFLNVNTYKVLNRIGDKT